MAGDNSVWEGFESEFFGDSGGVSLNETEPISGFSSAMAQNRQILNILFIDINSVFKLIISVYQTCDLIDSVEFLFICH